MTLTDSQIEEWIADARKESYMGRGIYSRIEYLEYKSARIIQLAEELLATRRERERLSEQLELTLRNFSRNGAE